MTDAQQAQITDQPTGTIPAPSIGIDGEDYLVSASDLAALAAVAGARANPLSVLPAAEVTDDRKVLLAGEFARLPEPHRQRLAIALGVLAAPAKIALLHHTIADETVSRGRLAWSTSIPNQIVALAQVSSVGRISYWRPASLSASFAKILAAEGKLTDDGIGCKMPLAAVVVFLAILDQLRAVRLHSMLSHSLPLTNFSQAEIAERLKDASQEDFRWPLNFLDKVISGLAASIAPADLAAAFEDLVKAKLIEVAMDAGPSSRYELTLAGKAIADEVLHDVSKLALSVCDQHSDGHFGHDITLWIRGPFHLILFAVSGKDGVICAVSSEEFQQMLNRSFTPAPAKTPPPAEEKPAPEAPTATPPPPSVLWYLSRNGLSEGPYDETVLRKMLEAMPPETMVWRDGIAAWTSAQDAGMAPAPAPPKCKSCGTVAEPGQRFCGNCGNPM